MDHEVLEPESNISGDLLDLKKAKRDKSTQDFDIIPRVSGDFEPSGRTANYNEIAEFIRTISWRNYSL